MGRKAVGRMLVLALGLAGCTQKCFVTECDLDHYNSIGLTADLECTPANCIEPKIPNLGAPATVNFPDREARHITLIECISMALENGRIGRQSFGFGIPFFDETLTLRQGVTTNTVRVLALDPAIAATDIEASLAKFDVRWRTSLTWNNTDRPVGTALETFQASQTATNAIQIQDASFSTGAFKPLPTGGIAGITFGTDYQFSNLNPRVNPSYRPALTMLFQQPLLRGFGVGINQLNQAHPGFASGTGLAPLTLSNQVEGILITRLNFDQERAEFERALHFMLNNVEQAYWNLYGAYANLYSQEAALRQAYEAWRINKERFDAGRIPIQDLAQSRGQYESFRASRLEALGSTAGSVLESERQLRALLGLPAEDGTRLVPIDKPILTRVEPDWDTALNEALSLRPELVLARNNVKANQLFLIRNKNLLLPDLRFVSSYDYNDIGNRLDGPSAANAFRNLSNGNFSNWRLGLELDAPIGYRNEHAAVRNARLNLARSYAVLRDSEERIQLFLAFAYRNVSFQYELIKIRRAEREAYGRQLEARFKMFIAGRGTLDFLLESQRNWASALALEYRAIADYNVALSTFQFAKGTIMQHNNVHIGEGPLPACAQVRAVEHHRRRSKALVCKERAVPIKHRPICGPDGCAIHVLPDLPEGEAPSIPALMEGVGPLPDEVMELPPTPREPGRFPAQHSMEFLEESLPPARD